MALPSHKKFSMSFDGCEFTIVKAADEVVSRTPADSLSQFVELRCSPTETIWFNVVVDVPFVGCRYVSQVNCRNCHLRALCKQQKEGLFGSKLKKGFHHIRRPSMVSQRFKKGNE